MLVEVTLYAVYISTHTIYIAIWKDPDS